MSGGSPQSVLGKHVEVIFRRSKNNERQWIPGADAIPRILPYVRPHWRLALATIGTTVLGALGAVVAPWPLKFLVDNVLGDEPLPPILDTLFGSLADDRYALLVFAVLAGLLVTLLVHGMS